MIREKEFEVVERIVDKVLAPPVGWIHGNNKSREVVEPRKIACWTMYYYTRVKLLDIGFYFGRISYSNVSTSVASINELRQTDYAMSVKIKSIIAEIESLGYTMVNKDGRDRLAHKTDSRAFRNVFKELKTKPNDFVFRYKACPKPKITTLNGIDLVDVALADRKIRSKFESRAIKQIGIFTDGIYFAEDCIRPSYQQLLDFYNSIPEEYYVHVKAVTKHTN